MVLVLSSSSMILLFKHRLFSKETESAVGGGESLKVTSKWGPTVCLPSDSVFECLVEDVAMGEISLLSVTLLLLRRPFGLGKTVVI